jgi:hypothetical protein
MGALLTVKGTDFSGAAIAFSPPVSAGLEYWNYFGDPTKTARNLALGKAAASIIGAPGAGANFATFTGLTNYVQTGLVDQTEVTLLAVARPITPAAATYKHVIGNYNGTSGNQAGSSLLFNNVAQGGPGVYNARSDGTNSQNSILFAPIGDYSGFGFIAGRMGATASRYDDKTRGLSANGTFSYPRAASNGQLYRIGSAVSAATGTQAVDVAFAAIYSRVLSDVELDAIYQKVKTYLAGKSIAI